MYAQGDPADSEIIANRIIAAAKNGERDSVGWRFVEVENITKACLGDLLRFFHVYR